MKDQFRGEKHVGKKIECPHYYAYDYQGDSVWQPNIFGKHGDGCCNYEQPQYLHFKAWYHAGLSLIRRC